MKYEEIEDLANAILRDVKLLKYAIQEAKTQNEFKTSTDPEMIEEYNPEEAEFWQGRIEHFTTKIAGCIQDLNYLK